MARSRSAWAVVAVTAAITLTAAACGRSAGGGGTSGNVSATKGLAATTAAGTKPVSSVTWAVYRDVNSLDPIFAFDYPENTAISLMCESLLVQAPDGSLQPGLATLANPSPTQFVFNLRPGVKFWDGHPVTAADVVYSLDRNTNPKLGGFYGAVFNRVQSIQATGPTQVTITLKQPDYWLEGELSSMPGVIIEKSFAQQQGKNYGTPAGSIMCTGAYMLKSWSPGVGVTAVANPHYWNTAVKTPLVQQILLKGAPDVSSFTSGMLTGGIQGSYSFGLATLDQLESSKAVKVYQGPGWSTDAFIVSSLSGALGDVRVRQALSLALNRQGIINSVYKGAALMPRWFSNPGTFGYGKSVFTAAYDAAPVMSQNLSAGQEAHPAGGRGREDDHDRHLEPAGQHLRGDRRLPGGGPGDRPQGRAQVGVGAELHQLLHRPQRQEGHRRVPDRELRRLRGPGRAAVHLRPAGRLAELRQLQRPGAHRGTGAGPQHGQPGPARGAHGGGREAHRSADALDT